MEASFVLRDFEILAETFGVDPLFYGSRRDLYKVLRVVSRSDLVVCWFGWDHAYYATKVAKMLAKPAIIISGGFEVANVPEIGYGSLLQSRTRNRVVRAFRSATLIIADSRFIRDSIEEVSGRQDVLLVPLGFDPAVYPLGEEKSDLVITVGDITESNMERKGLRSFLALSHQLPKTKFMMVGGGDESLMSRIRSSAPPNLVLTGRVHDAELLEIYKRAKVFVQASAHEGFGSAVAEAMLAGCFPVVTDRGALPEVVGPEGLVVPWRDVAALVEAVKTAIAASPESSLRCRRRIMLEFPLEERKRAIKAAVMRLL